MKRGAFAFRGFDEPDENLLGDLAGLEAFAVGVTVVDVLSEGGIGIGGGVVRGEEGDSGEEVFVGRVGEDADAGAEAVGGGGDAKVDEGATAADGEFAVVGIVDGEATGTVGGEIDGAIINTKAPGLGVVTGRGAHGGFQDGHDGVVKIQIGVHSGSLFELEFNVGEVAAPIGVGAVREQPGDFAVGGDKDAIGTLVVPESALPRGGGGDAFDEAGPGVGADGIDEAVGIEMEGQGGGRVAILEDGAGGVGVDGLPVEITEAGGVPGGFGQKALEFALGHVAGTAEVNHGKDGEGFDLKNADAVDIGVMDVGVDAGGHVDAGVPIKTGAVGNDTLGGGEGRPMGGRGSEVERAVVGEVDGGDGRLVRGEGECEVAGYGRGKSGIGGGELAAGGFEVGAKLTGARFPTERSVNKRGEANQKDEDERTEPHPTPPCTWPQYAPISIRGKAVIVSDYGFRPNRSFGTSLKVKWPGLTAVAPGVSTRTISAETGS